jgi:hypothetical protein
MIPLKGKYNSHFYFTDEEPGSEMFRGLNKVTQLETGTARFTSHQSHKGGVIQTVRSTHNPGPPALNPAHSYQHAPFFTVLGRQLPISQSL